MGDTYGMDHALNAGPAVRPGSSRGGDVIRAASSPIPDNKDDLKLDNHRKPRKCIPGTFVIPWR
jgi:hypothetical protein